MLLLFGRGRTLSLTRIFRGILCAKRIKFTFSHNSVISIQGTAIIPGIMTSANSENIGSLMHKLLTPVY